MNNKTRSINSKTNCTDCERIATQATLIIEQQIQMHRAMKATLDHVRRDLKKATEQRTTLIVLLACLALTFSLTLIIYGVEG